MVGSFDIRSIVCKLPREQTPELVIIKADATERCLPYNLTFLGCPKVLIVGDTHYLKNPISKLIRYALSEPFDYIIFDHTRHHAHLFAAAGVQNLYWLPALDYSYVPRQENISSYDYPLTFVGQTGVYHPYRNWVLNHLKGKGFPLQVFQGTLVQTAEIYNKSLITLNISLNGDLNLRVFEALFSGGFLITDRLSESSGLNLLFKSGIHLETWSNKDELVEKVNYYTNNINLALDIRKKGYEEIMKSHHPDIKRKELFNLIYHGKVKNIYDLKNDLKCRAGVKSFKSVSNEFTDYLIKSYEIIQEIHRTSEYLLVYCDGDGFDIRFKDLPRLEILPINDLVEQRIVSYDVTWITTQSFDKLDTLLTHFHGKIIIYKIDTEKLSILNSFGYKSVGNDLFLLDRPAFMLGKLFENNKSLITQKTLDWVIKNSDKSDDCLAISKIAGQLDMENLKSVALSKAIALDRDNAEALLISAHDALKRNDSVAALVLLEEANRVGLLSDEDESLRTDLHLRHTENQTIKEYYKVIGKTLYGVTGNPKTILIITNLFPSQELGGYGRKMWEFAWGLKKRGHKLVILTSDLPSLAKIPSTDEIELESDVSRTLSLLGTWNKGRPEQITNFDIIRSHLLSNAKIISETISTKNIDFALIGNLDFLGPDPINICINSGIRVLQALGNMTPGYSREQIPNSPLYKIGSCSQWNSRQLIGNGYNLNTIILYPGARTDFFYRLYTPDINELRICYAGLVMAFKGVQTLITALIYLKRLNIKFHVTIAGEHGSEEFIAELNNLIRLNDIQDNVTFSGFLDRKGLMGLFAKNNVLVFPSIVEEGFGISQVEAMASGLAVVSSGTGGAKEIIRDGVDGLIFQPENSLDLANKLLQLIYNPNLFKMIQKAAQLRALQFDVSKSVEIIEMQVACI